MKLLPAKYADYLAMHVYAPIHSALLEKTQPIAAAITAAADSTAAADGSAPGTVSVTDAAIATATTGNGAGEEASDDNEKQLLSTIEQFRLRQLQRDKQVEEEKRRLIKLRIAQMKQAARIRAEQPVPTKQEPQLAQQQERREDAAAQETIGEKRVRADEGEHSAELEAKRRRKLQVLQLLSGEAEEGEEVAPSAEKKPAKITLGMGGRKASGAAPGAAAASSSGAVAGAAIGAGFGASRPVLGGLEDDEDKPRREMVKLEYTAEELLEMEKAAVMSELQQQQEDDEDLDGNLRKRNPANAANAAVAAAQAAAAAAAAQQAADAGTAAGLIQAKIRAQALAISASLQQQQQQQQLQQQSKQDEATATAATAAATATATASSAAAGGNAKAEMKALVDQIPADR